MSFVHHVYKFEVIPVIPVVGVDGFGWGGWSWVWLGLAWVR